MTSRLRPGDVVLLFRQPCRVLKVTDCAAVVAVPRPAREFVTLAGKSVRFTPKPHLVRISPNSETPILNRQNP